MLHPSHALVELDFDAVELIPLQGCNQFMICAYARVACTVYMCWMVRFGLKLKVSAGIL